MSRNSNNASDKSPDTAETNQVPTISHDYAMPKSNEGKDEEVEIWQVLVGVDHDCNWIMASMVPRKGPDQFAVHIVSNMIEASGYNKVIVKSDQRYWIC